MRSLILYSLLCLVLTSCSLPIATVLDEPLRSEGKSARLLNIRIERWEELRFSGLLALQEQEDGLRYVLLDATGVKLLEGLAKTDGKHIMIRAGGALKDAGLNEFLSEALARLYLYLPEQLPCSRSWLLRLCCLQDSENKWSKSAYVGPVRLWQATEKEVDGGGGETTVTYCQPWLGVRIFLKKVDHIR
ncbi:MAG: hypothetical protein WBB23_11145 [Desulforhopalus sp.]